MKNLLLIGSRGMLGGALHRVLSARHLVSTLDRDQFDITRAEWGKLSLEGYDFVLNAAGLINRRDESAGNFYSVNAVFPHVLSALCVRSGARLIHFSTDCVFDGVAAPFYEDSPRGAADLYGQSKSLGEPIQALVIRTSIIGPETRNFYNLLCWALAQNQINGFTNHIWNGVTTLELARLIDRIISGPLFTEGVRHIFSGDCSKHDLLNMICGAFAHPARITPALAPQARDTRLRTKYPVFLQALEVRPIQRQLQDLLAVSGPQGQLLMQGRNAA